VARIPSSINVTLKPHHNHLLPHAPNPLNSPIPRALTTHSLEKPHTHILKSPRGYEERLLTPWWRRWRCRQTPAALLTADWRAELRIRLPPTSSSFFLFFFFFWGRRQARGGKDRKRRRERRSEATNREDAREEDWGERKESGVVARAVGPYFSLYNNVFSYQFFEEEHN
jgi:hypothetical protein